MIMRGGTGAIALTFALVLVACGGGENSSPSSPTVPTSTQTDPPVATESTPPTSLSLPVNISGIVLVGLINPFGVVRSSLDSPSVGHSGIDLPSNTGAPIFAVASGEIILMEPETDGMPGSEIWLLIAPASSPGTGWVFLYEHVNPLPGLTVGSRVVRRQQIATNAQNPSFTNHLELSFVFNEQGFRRSQTCWVDQLDAGVRTRLLDRFNNELRTNQRFIDGWTTVQFEGKLPFKELLNTEKYPDGARLCYRPGTDERVKP